MNKSHAVSVGVMIAGVFMLIFAYAYPSFETGEAIGVNIGVGLIGLCGLFVFSIGVIFLLFRMVRKR